MKKYKLYAFILNSFGEDFYRILQYIYSLFLPLIRLPYSIIGLFKNKSKYYIIDGLQFKFPSSNLYEYGKNFQDYELRERILVKKYLNEKDTILELGGSVGVVSCFINKILYNKKQHVVVEPNPNVISFLQKNKEKNSCDFIVEQCIISNVSSEMDLYIGKSHLSSSIHQKNHLLDSIETVSVKCLTVNKLFIKHGLEFDTLIMDIEGDEYNFLLENEITNFKKMIIEFHPDILGKNKLEECKRVLIENSFILLEKIGDVEFWKK